MTKAIVVHSSASTLACSPAACIRRRVLMRLLCCVLVPAASVIASADPAQDPVVTVRHEGGVYSVAAQFQVPQPPAVALEVLTDYEEIARFMPDIKTSTVRERTAGRVVVEQEGVSHLMMFSKRVHLLLEITEESGQLRFRDSSGKSFTHYEGSWRISGQDGGTTIIYALTAKPAFDLPETFLSRLLRRDSRRMIESLRKEMAARASRQSARIPL